MGEAKVSVYSLLVTPLLGSWEREVREVCVKSYNVGKKKEIYWAFFIDTPKPPFLTLEGGFQGLGLAPTPPSGFIYFVCVCVCVCVRV